MAKSYLYYFGERILLAVFGIETEEHSHFAASLLFSRKEAFLIRDSEGKEQFTKGILLPPNYKHTLFAKDKEMLILQLDPRSEEYKRIPKALLGVHLPDPILDKVQRLVKPAFESPLDCKAARNLYNQIILSLGSEVLPFPNDVRIQKAILWIKQAIPESIRLTDLSEDLGISPDRFMHLFKEKMGIPLRQYVLWQRLHRAASLLQEGSNLTDASHGAGFSDQAHLSRTFKKMFGVPPSLFLGKTNDQYILFCSPTI